MQCFGDDTCYSLAFGIPALLMFIATVIIIIGNIQFLWLGSLAPAALRLKFKPADVTKKIRIVCLGTGLDI